MPVEISAASYYDRGERKRKRKRSAVYYERLHI